jgi:hypothetical protein
MNLRTDLSQLVWALLGKKNKIYQFTPSYRDFVKKLTKCPDFLKDKVALQKSVLKEALRVNIVTPAFLATLHGDAKSSVHFIELEKIKTIQDPTYVCAPKP